MYHITSKQSVTDMLTVDKQIKPFLALKLNCLLMILNALIGNTLKIILSF
jgi:hypothetical protein